MILNLQVCAVAGAVMVASAVAWSPVSAAAASIEGTWKIAKPASSFTPTDGPIPFTADTKGDYEDNRAALAKGDFSFDRTQSRCSSPGVPRLALTPQPFRIWVRPLAVTFQYEWNRLTRSVDMTGRKVDAPFAGPAVGFSEGHWEGNTLVIKGQYFSDATLIDDLVPHSDSMVVDERLHLKGPNTLEDDLTITDPDSFTRPWHTKVTYTRQPDQAFAEDICLDRLNAGQMPLPLIKR